MPRRTQRHPQLSGRGDLHGGLAGGRDTQLDALVETAHSYTSQPEMHAGYRGQSIDDDDGGVYKHGRIGFQRR